MLAWQLTFAALCLLASSTWAKPTNVVRKSPVTLPFARRMNVTGSRDILNMDVARAKSLRSKTTEVEKVQPKSQDDLWRQAVGSAFGVPSTNQGVDYVVEVSNFMRASL